MAQTQYNFKIEEDLKDEADLLSNDFNNKQEFLQALLSSYKTLKSSNVDTDIDMSKYENINAQTKSMLSDTFKHIIYTLQQNSTTTQQGLISLEKDKKSIEEERESFQKQIEILKAEANQELLDVQKLHKLELEATEIQITKAAEAQKEKDIQFADLQSKLPFIIPFLKKQIIYKCLFYGILIENQNYNN